MMSNAELVSKLELLVREERRITQEILEVIREAEKRRLYLELGFEDIYDWLTRKYGYSHSSANRRIQAARLLDKVPEAKEKLSEGTLNLTLLTQVQSAVRQAERDCGRPLAIRSELLQRVEGKSTREAERILAAEFPEQKPRETVRAINGEESKLTIVLNKEDLELLQAIKHELSHSRPNASNSEITSFLLHKHTKKPALNKAQDGPRLGSPFMGSGYTMYEGGRPGLRDKRRVTSPKKLAKLRAGGKCEYKNEKTGKVCGSKYQIEVDHIIPKALGGLDELSNLRCLCKQHNLFEAERKLGKEFMSQYRMRP